MKRKSSLSAGLVALGFALSGCGGPAGSKSGEKSNNEQTDTSTEQQAEESVTAADKFSDHIENSLIAAGMSAEQAHALGDQVMDSIDGSASLSLQAADKNDLSQIGPMIVEKFTEALGKEGVAGDDDKKGDLAGVIADSSIVFVKDIAELADDLKNEIRGKFLAAVVEKLDEAGVSQEKMTKVIAKVSQKALTALEKSGMSSDKIIANIPQVMDKLFDAIAKTGLDKDKMADGIGEVAEGVSKGLVDTNASDGDFFSNALSSVMDKSVSLMDKVGIKEPEKIAIAMEKLAAAGAEAVREVKVKKAATVKAEHLAAISEKISLKANEAALAVAKKLDIAADKIASATESFSSKFDESQKEILAEKYAEYIAAKEKAVEAVVNNTLDATSKEEYYAKLEAEKKLRCEALKGEFIVTKTATGATYECKLPTTTTPTTTDKPTTDGNTSGFQLMQCGAWGDKLADYKLKWMLHNGISSTNTSTGGLSLASGSFPFCTLASANDACAQWSSMAMELMDDPMKPGQCVSVAQ